MAFPTKVLFLGLPVYNSVDLYMKKTNLEAKCTKSYENFSKLKGKTQNFEKKLKNSSKKLKVSANPLGLLAENRSKKRS